jgi:hypothetical protein
LLSSSCCLRAGRPCNDHFFEKVTPSLSTSSRGLTGAVKHVTALRSPDTLGYLPWFGIGICLTSVTSRRCGFSTATNSCSRAATIWPNRAHTDMADFTLFWLIIQIALANCNEWSCVMAQTFRTPRKERRLCDLCHGPPLFDLKAKSWCLFRTL